jgi:hypothetical protein
MSVQNPAQRSKSMMAEITQKLRKITFWDTVCFLEAAFLLLVAALLKTLLPMRWYARRLGELCANGVTAPVEVERERLIPVIKAVNRAVKYSPFKGKCLSQALCGLLMLRARKLPSDFYLGVNKDETGDVIAHAWLKSGKYFVTGQTGHRKYVVISVFSHRPSAGGSSS